MQMLHFIKPQRFLTSFSIKHSSGSSVTAGDLLDEYADSSPGRSTGPHLHFEWWGLSGKRLNPQRFLEIVMPGTTAKDTILFQGKHQVTGQPKMHSSYDLIGPWRT